MSKSWLNVLATCWCISGTDLLNCTCCHTEIEVANQYITQLCHFLTHCGISGNEQADILAKEGARGEQYANNVSFSEKKTLIRALTMPRSQRDDYHLLSRKQQVVLVRLRTGHNRLNSHMHGKLKLASSPTCPCGQEDQTTEHILQ